MWKEKAKYLKSQAEYERAKTSVARAKRERQKYSGGMFGSSDLLGDFGTEKPRKSYKKRKKGKKRYEYQPPKDWVSEWI